MFYFFSIFPNIFSEFLLAMNIKNTSVFVSKVQDLNKYYFLHSATTYHL